MTGLQLDDMLDLLGYQPGELFQLCTKAPGGPFVAEVLDAPPVELPQDRDVWFGPNPVRRVDGGRPAASDVTRLAAVWTDLDVKPSGCADFDVCRAIVDDLAGLVGTPPTWMTYSGHGIQAVFAVEDEPITDNPSDARALLRRWGRLVAAVAERRGAKVDTVFDLPRILRAPGTLNHKGDPVPVVAVAAHGAPLGYEQIAEVLDEYGIPDLPDDHADPGTVVSAPADWAWRDPDTARCPYVAGMIKGWQTDTPNDRHPWLVNHATRIASLHRRGCLTPEEHQQLVEALVTRFRALIAVGGQQREPGPGEIADALAWGQQRAAAKSDTALATEFGDHMHSDAAMPVPSVLGPPKPPDELAERRRQREQVDTGGSLLDGDPAPIEGTAARKPEKAPDTLRQSEDGNANALIERHGHGIRWCHERARWLLWNGHRWVWQPPGGGHVRELAKDVARTTLPDGDWRKRSLSAIGVSNTLTSASTDPRVVVALDDLDADPWALNTPAGVVDLRTGELRASDPASLHTRSTALTPDTAGGEVWDRFLATTFGGDIELVGYLQRLAGYSATGHIGAHVLPFAYGSGGNGKGVFLETIGKVLGDYATTAPNGFLMARQFSQHETEIARLAGARMVLCSEVNENDRFDEAKIKQLTGGDTLTARFMRQDHFTFTPSHHLWLMGNYRPAVTSGGRSFWRRCRLIPFAHEVPEHERIDDLQGILATTAGPAVLAWVIAGAAEYARAGLQEPESVVAATAEYARDQDTVARFVDECCHLADSAVVKVNTRELLQAYEQWCAETGETGVTAKRFGSDLRNRFNVGDNRSNGKRFYTGIALSRTEESNG